MPTLGEILGGTPTTGMQTPGANDPGYEDRKKGWVQSLKEMTKDPAAMGTLIQMGMTFSGARPGTDPAIAGAQAAGAGLAYQGRVAQAQLEQQREAERQAQQQQRIDLEARRAGLAEQQMGQQVEQFGQTMGLKREQLEAQREERKLDRESRMTIERMRQAARVRGAGGGGGTAEERMISRLQTELESSLEEAARTFYQMKKAKSPQEAIMNLAPKLMREPDILIEGDTGVGPMEAVQMAQQIYQAAQAVEQGELAPQGEREAAAAAQGARAMGTAENPIEIQSEAQAETLPKGTVVRLNGTLYRVD